MKIQRKKGLFYVIFALIFLILILLYFFNQFEEILYLPFLSPAEWCEHQPCMQIEFFSTTFTLVQPTSTFLVYFLGILTATIGIYLLRVSKKQNYVVFWGIALILWGLGALFAGTSYQAFSYELKCAGRSLCIWTSWWEVVYLVLSVGSVDAMMLAQASLNSKGEYYTAMRLYAACNFLVYVPIVVIGSVIPIKFLISFELMVIFLVPSILIFILFNLRRYLKLKQSIDKQSLLIWLLLIIIMGAYFLYLIAGITEMLWGHGIWFSENDILHIGLIAWMIYIGFAINKYKPVINNNDE